jgi:CspA family cold shock protein
MASPDGRYPGLGYSPVFKSVFNLPCMSQGSKTMSVGQGRGQEKAIAMITGTVKFFNTTKGFGFISPEGGNKDAFVHISAVERSGLQGLYEGDKVTYEMETGRDGKDSAVNLKLIS